MRYALITSGIVAIFASQVLAANSYAWPGVVLAALLGIAGGTTMVAGFRS